LVRGLLDNPIGLYELTQLKREPKDFSEKEMLAEIRKRAQMHPLYAMAERLLPTLEISNESIKYYASLVRYYTVFRLNRLDANLVDIYLLCFVHHRYQKLHDNLINYFIYLVRHYQEGAKQAAKDKVYAYRLAYNRNLKKAGQVLRLFTGEQVDPKMPFGTVQNQAFAILERRLLAQVAEALVGKLTFDEKAFQWEHLDEISRQFKRRLRILLCTIEFVIGVICTTPQNSPIFDKTLPGIRSDCVASPYLKLTPALAHERNLYRNSENLGAFGGMCNKGHPPISAHR
jgi:hypothetical protein